MATCSCNGRPGPFIALVFCVLHVFAVKAENFTLEVYLTNPNPTQPDTYLTEAKELPSDRTYYIIGFEPTVTMDVVHHMIVSGCKEITHDGGNPECSGDSACIYAWAKNAPGLHLPQGVGFKIGKEGYKGLYLQLHFAEVSKLAGKNMNQLGVKILYTDVPQPKLAGVFLMGTMAGVIEPNTKETFDVTCKMNDDVQMHMFSFRPHTHHLGLTVAGYRIQPTSKGNMNWTLIGKQDPQKPQMFYPSNAVVVKKGDIMAARCTMFNDKDHTVLIGGMSNDEMCNFYAMYWVDDGRFPSVSSCWSAGPPNYYWNADASLSNIPADSEKLD